MIQHEKDMLDEYISQSEKHGYVVSTEYYDSLIAKTKESNAKLVQERDAMNKALNEAVNSGAIEEYSESWYDLKGQINDVTKSIEEGNTALIEYANSIREIQWEVFDMLQDKISNVADEAQFLIDLMDNKELYKDNGQLTDEGMATMGQHGVKYNVYMAQANKYAQELQKINKELANDPYNKDLMERRQDLLEAQREAILNAEDEKNAIKDMVSEGIDKELDALQKLIDKRNDALDAEKDLYTYQKKVKEQTKDIADLEKQMAAYAGDESEETKAKIQKIKVDLEDAKADLEETEYDQYISDQQKMLDDLYDQYETILNMRLDDIDALIADMITEINENANTIGATITEQADKVGYTLTDSMNTIWLSGNGSISNVITMYGNKFDSALTTTNKALGDISGYIQNMMRTLNISGGGSGGSSSSSGNSSSKSSATTSKSSNGGDGIPKIGDKVTFASGWYYYDSYGSSPAGHQYQGSEVYITNINTKGSKPYHISTGSKLGDGDLGWLNLEQLRGYASGNKKLLSDEYAWTQEDGSEMIIRPSDGAVLTPLAKNDSVLSATASRNIFDMANSPADFIKDNLDLEKVGANTNASSQTTYTQNLDKVIFNLPNVKNYNELLAEMQRDKNFERLISSMTIDRLAGKSALAKGKAIR